MTDMKSLHQIIIEKGGEYEFEKIDPDHLIGMVNNAPFIVRAILDRTAVIHPIDDDVPAARKLAKLENTFVWPQDIKWKPR